MAKLSGHSNGMFGKIIFCWKLLFQALHMYANLDFKVIHENYCHMYTQCYLSLTFNIGSVDPPHTIIVNNTIIRVVVSSTLITLAEPNASPWSARFNARA